MKRFRGMIALDIDGTITIEKHVLEKEVCDYLNSLIEDGWLLTFVTGRTFSFAKPLLASLKGIFFFAVQNGAALFQMPEEKLLKKHYINAQFLSKLDVVFLKEAGGLLVESGKEKGDICFYKPADFTEKELEYIGFRIEISPEKWIPVDSFEELDIAEFAVGKFFAKKEKAHEIAERIHKISPNAFNIEVIRDPFRAGWHLAHVNDRKASKGKILSDLAHLGELKIAAGDDYNDREMLQKAKVKIVMENAPLEMRELADIVAPAAEKQGIIFALKEAIERWKV